VDDPQHRFDSLFEFSRDGVLLTRPDGTILRANPAASRMLGRSEEEICRLGRAGIVVADEKVVAMTARREADGSAEGELSFLRPDGSVFPGEVTTGMIPRRDAPPLAYSIIRDISERRRLERAHARAHRALGLLTQCNQAVVRATGEASLFREICDVVVEVGGYRMCWVGLVDGDDERKSVRPVAHAGHEDGYLASADIVWSESPRGRGPTGTAIRTQTPVIGDFTRDTALAPWQQAAFERGYRISVALPLAFEGERFGVLTMYSPEPDAFDEEEVGILRQLSSDLSYGVHALRQRVHRERLATAIEQAAETVVVTDLEGTILYVNPAFEAVSGYTRAEAVGKNPRVLKSGELDPRIYRELWATITSGATWRGRLVNRTKGGALFTEETTISPVRDAGGAVVSYVAVKRDITRDLSLEAQLRQSQKMEGIGRLAGGVAHDFNNLLSVILGCTDLALAELRPGDPIRDDLVEIAKAGQRAAALTRQLLAFSRKQVLQPVTLQLNAVVAGLEPMLRRVLGEDIEYAQTLDPDLGLVRADPGQLEQVIVNLVVNARDAMPRGGRLTVETATVELDAGALARHPGAKAGPHAALTVRDTGVGMDASTLAHAFEPFFTTKGPGEGTGLGLATVHGIVEQSGGHIDVASQPDGGTTFTVFLPVEPSRGSVAAGPRGAARRSGSETVLVAEDERAVRSLVTRVLTAAGYTVLDAANGPEALALCERQETAIHLLLTDVVMPAMSGKALADLVTKARPGLKVLFMSGYTDDAIARHGVLDPDVHFLAKPILPAELLRKVREALDAEPVVTP